MSRGQEPLPDWVVSLIDQAPVGRLGFVDHRDHPRVLPVTFVFVDGRFYSAVDDKPKRVDPSELARLQYLRRRPQAALTVDQYDDDWRMLRWVQVLGRVEVLEAGPPEAIQAMVAKYSGYRGRPPDGPVLRLDPARILHWKAR